MKFERTEITQIYHKDINKSYVALTKQEESDLASKIQDGDVDALNRLVTANLKYVVTMANKHVGLGITVDDLICEGNLGMIEAARRFKPDAGVKFISYATFWIKKYMNEAIGTYGRIVRLPMNLEYEAFKAKKTGQDFEVPTTVEIDSPISEEDDTTLADIILRTESEIEEQIESDHFLTKVNLALSKLKPRDREIIELVYGVNKEYSMTVDVVAERMNISSTRVNQILRAAEAEIKKIF